MANALVTICAPIPSGKLAGARAAIQAFGNPARPDIAARLAGLSGDEGLHFASLHALASTDAEARRGTLVLEFSADGSTPTAVRRLALALEAELRAVFAFASDWSDGDLAAYLQSHTVRIGQGWIGQPGLVFAGTPDMTVGRIHKEARLAAAATQLVGAQEVDVPALERLEQVRSTLRADPDLAWALETPAALPQPRAAAPLALAAPLAAGFARTFLWPLLGPLIVILAGGLLFGWLEAPTLSGPMSLVAWDVARTLWGVAMWLIGVALLFVVPLLILGVVLFISLRRKEASDWLDDRGAEHATVREILAVENQGVGNHMVSITSLKSGFTRQATLRFAFWIIGALAGLSFKPGHLGDIGTIHFARWLVLPGTRDLAFFSNYGGSWESYLEDFITKAHAGLTAVWSNCLGFPRTENLFQKGATDGERFKRFARRSMVPTPFWFSAYPDLTTANIRTNAAIRVGLAAAMTDQEATTWLALFGSAARPASKIESRQVQSLVFGGLGFLPYGKLMLIDLADDLPTTRGWLTEITPLVAFDDGRRYANGAIVTLALGPGALRKAGLPRDALESFPIAYLDGMTGPGRARILGDDPGTQDPDRRWWWRGDRPYDVALLVYGKTRRDMERLVRQVSRATRAYGHAVGRTVPLETIDSATKAVEPFGFVDGVSQPAIRGTYRGLRNADPIHLVEPGEFVLGYPDNRGNTPPGPVLKAGDDPDNRLPLLCGPADGLGDAVADRPRDLGRNGSFLVIRQLEQDVGGFRRYCDRQAERLKNRLGDPYAVTRDFIAAKLIGRWPDGSSLARNPYQPYTKPSPLGRSPTSRPAGRAHDASAIAAAPSAQRAQDNDFLLGSEDPEGLRCPFGAHIRRANPRDSLDPGSQDQIEISNRHRILRVGRAYRPARGERKGLIFMCLNGDLERQFEFVQQTWLGSETFHGLAGERDPLTTDKAGGRGFTLPSRDGPIRLDPLERFVTTRGGGYFFLPSRKLLQFLGEGRPRP